jgi:hypothetical protein
MDFDRMPYTELVDHLAVDGDLFTVLLPERA